MHDEPSRALSSENMHVIIPVFRPQYFLYLLVFGGHDVQNTDPVFPRTLGVLLPSRTDVVPSLGSMSRLLSVKVYKF